jgi:RNA polymerase sigma factor (sigma-70 family)
MAASALIPVMRCLSRLAGSPAGDLSDAELLERYCRGGEEAAFALLVQRHGPAVLGVCRRALGNTADADDAFQATFLVLLRRADSIRRGAALGCWLYGVALRVAANARARRAPLELPGHDLPGADGDPVRAATGRELLAVLDEEVRGLPEKYRAALVLCGLEGRTCEQAARELGWPKSTVIHRLSQARQRLRQRLTRRGFEVPAALLAALLAKEAAAAHVPAILALATVRQARQRVTVAAAPASGGRSLSRWVVVAGLAGALGVMAGAGAFRGGAEPQLPLPAAAAEPAGSAAPAPRADREGFPLPTEALARVGSARLRHGRYLSYLEYSPDGTLLASSGNGRLRIWDVRTGKLVREITVAERKMVWDRFFSADGKSVVVLDESTFRWIDVRTGEEVRHCHVEFTKGRWYAYLAPHCEMCAVPPGSPTGDLVVYDLPSGKERFRKTGGRFSFGNLAFSPDGKVLAALDGDPPLAGTRVRLFDTEAGREVGEIDPGETVRGLAFSPDGKSLVAHDLRQNLTVWQVPTGKVLHRIRAEVNALVTAAFTPDGKSLVVGTQGLDAIRIDLSTGKELQHYRTHPSSTRLAFAPDGKSLAVGIGTGEIRLCDLASGKPVAASAEPAVGSPQIQRCGPFDEGNKLLWVRSDDYAAVDWAAGRVVRRVRPPGGQGGQVLAVSPDRSRVLAGGTPGNLTVYDAATGKEIGKLPVVPNAFLAAPVFSPDGKTFYTARWSGPIQAWETETGKELPAVDKKQTCIRSLVLSRDGRRLAAAGHPQVSNPRPEIVVWDPVERRELCRLTPPDGGRTWGLALSPDGNTLAAVGGETGFGLEHKRGFLALWDLPSGGQKLARTGVEDNFITVAFSEDGRTLVTGGDDGSLRLWEAATGQERHRFAGHEGMVYSVACSPDGKLVAAASSDAPVFIWDVTGCYGQPPAAGPLPADEAAALWDRLREGNAANAFTAMRQLLRCPGPAVTFLRDHLKPAAVVDEKTLQRLLRDLEADDFDTREKATRDLGAVADRAESRLRKALEGNVSAEVKRGIELALEAAASAPERWREVRAVEVLERLGTPEARQLLAALAGGAKESLLTREARAAAGRLKGP